MSAPVSARQAVPQTVFISYSRKDAHWRDRLLTHLGVLEKDGQLSVWSDADIGTGADWHRNIDAAMEDACVAVLLVSANFLTSPFILETEIPRLKHRRDSHGLHLYPVIVTPCAWKAIAWLSALQVRPAGSRPLSGGSDYEIDLELSEIALEIRDLVARCRQMPSPHAERRPAEEQDRDDVGPPTDRDAKRGPRPLVLGLHGARTRLGWQALLRDELDESGFDYSPFVYGYTSLLSAVLGGPRAHLAHFRRYYEDVVGRHGRLPSVIAEGFGAYLVGSALRHHPDLRFDRAILLDCPLPTDFPWTEFVVRDRVQGVLHEFGRQDVFGRLLARLMPEAGRAGTQGFTDAGEGKVLQRAQPYFGHADFFRPRNIADTWLPFLKGEALKGERPARAVARRPLPVA